MSLISNFFLKSYRSIWREWLLFHLADQNYRFMFEPPPENEWVVLDCETTGLNPAKDEIISIGAVRIKGSRLLTSERLELIIKPERKISTDSIKVHRLRELDVAHGLEPEVAMGKLMHFIGSRPIVGYYLEFDISMINKVIWRMLGMGLPQPKIEVSSMFYDYKNRQLPVPHQGGTQIDLRFNSMMQDLDLPSREAHDALNDAVMTGMAFIKLRQLLA